MAQMFLAIHFMVGKQHINARIEFIKSTYLVSYFKSFPAHFYYGG